MTDFDDRCARNAVLVEVLLDRRIEILFEKDAASVGRCVAGGGSEATERVAYAEQIRCEVRDAGAMRLLEPRVDKLFALCAQRMHRVYRF